MHDGAAGGFEYHRADVLQPAEAVIHDGQEQARTVFEAPGRHHQVVGTQHTRHIRNRQAVGLQSHRVDDNLVLRIATAEHRDLGHTVHRGQQRSQVVEGEVLQVDQGGIVRGNRVAEHRENSRVHTADPEDVPGGQVRCQAGEFGFRLQRRRCHILAPVERDRDFRGAAAGLGADAVDAGYGAQGLFRGPGDLHHHLVRGTVPGLQGYRYAREIDRGKQADRQAQQGKNACRCQHHECGQHEAPLARQPVAHGAAPAGAVRILMPSARVAAPSTMMSSPVVTPLRISVCPALVSPVSTRCNAAVPSRARKT